MSHAYRQWCCGIATLREQPSVQSGAASTGLMRAYVSTVGEVFTDLGHKRSHLGPSSAAFHGSSGRRRPRPIPEHGPSPSRPHLWRSAYVPPASVAPASVAPASFAAAVIQDDTAHPIALGRCHAGWTRRRRGVCVLVDADVILG
jgi:hypothetical protein